MNKIVLTLIAVLLFVCPAFAGNFGELQFTTAPDGTVTPQAKVWAQRSTGVEGLSVFGWGVGGQHWSEVYAGLAYSPAPWIEITAGAGVEDADEPFRWATSLWLGHGPVSLYVVREDGGSGVWSKAVGLYAISDRFKVGGMAQSYAGVGPRINVAITSDVALWSALLEKSGERSWLTGFTIGF